MQIQFLGAAQTVTGSKYLIQTDKIKILVDCGLYQGYKELRLRNWEPLPVPPAELDYVLLTHAHIDHSGYIPLLVKNGFRGKILCHRATYDLCSILLPDSGHLHEEEAEYANRKGYSKHHPALPLYTKKDAEKSLRHFKPIEFDKPIQLQDLQATFHYGGHILGASLIRLQDEHISILFTGDLGRASDPVMYPPADPPPSDYYVIESTYGDRLHEKIDPEHVLEKVINRTFERKGVILIPSFAVGRAQLMLYYIYILKKKNKIPDIPVFIDSPMATDATEIFCHHASLHRLNPQETKEVCQTAEYVQTINDSKQLDKRKKPMIIISASGMATGGRVIHHIKEFGPYKKSAIVFCGFQAKGTRGDRIVSGEKKIKMFGQMIKINAEVAQLENISAHADYEEMLAWLGRSKTPPKKIFVTHGELESAQALQQLIVNQLDMTCEIPSYLDTRTLE